MGILSSINKVISFTRFKSIIKDVSNSHISINGDSIITGKNMSIINDDIYIDGVKINVKDLKEINVTIIGDVEKLDIAACKSITINGNCNKIDTISGNVKVEGYVKDKVGTTSGNINVRGNIGGNVDTISGDVTASTIMGKCSTMSGDIKK